ncbi:MAG: DUF1631 family protein [Pseudomarimonas sp.]
MQATAIQDHSSPAPRLLAQAGLPRRALALTEGVLKLTSDELRRWLAATMDEFELTLFRLAEGARNYDLQRQYSGVLDESRRARPLVPPLFLAELEASIASLRSAPKTEAAAAAIVVKAQTLSLVNDVDIEEDIVLKEAATRAEMRCGMPLFLLGQRFGVLASRPAFDAEHLPIGPKALCRILRSVVHPLKLENEHRVLLFRQFEKHMSVFASSFYDSINAYLVAEGVLPHMTFVPVRLKRGPVSGQSTAPRPVTAERAPPPSEVPPAAAVSTRAHPAAHPPADGKGDEWGDESAFARAAALIPSPSRGGERGSQSAVNPPAKRYPDKTELAQARSQTATDVNAAIAADLDSPLGDEEFFNSLRRLMDGKRSLLGKLGSKRPPPGARAAVEAQPAALQGALSRLQTSSPPTVRVGDRSVVRSVSHLKQDLMTELRQVSEGGAAAALREEDNDAIDLVGMLFDQVMKDVRPNSAAASLLAKLQVPLLRVALEDRKFFSQSEHPGRQMLNAVAEATFHLSADDEVDRDLANKMGMVVERVGREFDGDLGLLERLAGDIGQQVQAQTRKAEIAERRHVEAARGKEKLETARLHAAEAIDARLAGKRIPKFLRSLLDQSWADVLALSALREGENSESYRHQLQIADRLIHSAVSARTTGAASIPPTEVQPLREEIEQALGQVGYHIDDARAVAARLLTSTADEEDDDSASRTELALKLKQRTRFGQSGPGATGAAETTRADQLEPAERKQLDALKRLPFGTWFEMTTPERKEPVRRRMAWFSPVTGNCLLVNHRGQRQGEFSLAFLAREIVAGRASVLAEDTSTLVDRAWKAIVSTLRSFGGGGAQPAEAAT